MRPKSLKERLMEARDILDQFQDVCSIFYPDELGPISHGMYNKMNAFLNEERFQDMQE